jgi:hypothetical protein
VEEIKAACDEMGLATDIDPNNKLQNVFGTPHAPRLLPRST